MFAQNVTLHVDATRPCISMFARTVTSYTRLYATPSGLDLTTNSFVTFLSWIYRLANAFNAAGQIGDRGQVD